MAGRPPLPLARVERIGKLIREGFSKSAIARMMGLSRTTVWKRAKQLPPPPPPPPD